MKKEILKTEGLCKSFGNVMANENIDFKLCRGEILAILGENGSGKTTLINMISGIYYPDKGNIYVNGERVCIRTPKDACRLGIGVVYQHFMLVNEMTAIENILICPEVKDLGRTESIREKVKEICDKYGFSMKLDKKIYNMSVSEKQTVEIVKNLIKGVEILILDEPTAVLTPRETEGLFSALKAMKADGKAILIVTHKVQEILSVSDKVFIMNKGKYVDTLLTKETTEAELVNKMVGHSVALSLERSYVSNKEKIISVQHLFCRDKEKNLVIEDATFDVYSGEILGMAGIAGSGQRELCEALAGVNAVSKGKIVYFRENNEIHIENINPRKREREKINIGFVPEDRLGMGLAASANITENVMLRDYKYGRSPFLNKKYFTAVADKLVEKLQIDADGINTPVKNLSGGNIQKVLLGREIERNPKVLIVSYPARGLDINSSYMVYHLLNEEKKKGAAVIFVGEDLDILLEISDRIMVLSDHKISGILDARKAVKEDIGSLMTKNGEEILC